MLTRFSEMIYNPMRYTGYKVYRWVIGYTVSSDCSSGYQPHQNIRGPRSSVAVYVTAAMPFFASLVKCFSAIPDFSDCVYIETSIVPTKTYLFVEIPLKKK